MFLGSVSFQIASSNRLFSPFCCLVQLCISASIQSYTDLNWRLDVEVASRTRQNAVTPSFVLKLNTVSGSMGDVKNETIMTSDFANMQHLKTELAAAGSALKSTRSIRVTRFLT